MQAPEELRTIASQVKGEGGNPTATVRTLLGWFGVSRRGKHKVVEIEETLRRLEIETWPNFEGVYIDGEIEFRSLGSSQEVVGFSNEEATGGTDSETEDNSVSSDPVPRLAVLQAANSRPVSIKRDESLSKAYTHMISHDFSQLPVMQSDRKPEGFVSWKTIGTAISLNRPLEKVRDVMDRDVTVLKADTPLFDAVGAIVANEFVLVEGVGQKITGLVTTSDISLQFNELSKPFLLLAQIEGHLRRLISDKFDQDDIAAAANPSDTDRNVEGVSDLTFGEYIRLLQPEERWNKLGVHLDRKVFLERLERIRVIRNNVMHFDPDALDSEDVIFLDESARFIRVIASR